MDLQLITTALGMIVPLILMVLVKYHVPQRAFTAIRDATQEALTWTPPAKPETPQILTDAEVDALEQDVLYTPLSDLIREGENRAILKWNEAHPHGPLYACTDAQGRKYFTLTRKGLPYEFNPTCPDCTWATTESMTTVTRTRTDPCTIHAIRQEWIFPQPKPAVASDEVKVLEWLNRPNPDPEVEPEEIHTGTGNTYRVTQARPMVNLRDVQGGSKPGDYSLSGYQHGWNIIAKALEGEGLLHLEQKDRRKAYQRWQESLGYRGPDADGVPGLNSLRALMRSQGGFGITLPKGVTITPNDENPRHQPQLTKRGRMKFRGRP